jgi:uncharacterized protein YodC (DUF2158 family)
MTFGKGDIVALKSGGPALTVLSVDGEMLTCMFFSEELGEFKVTMLPAFAVDSYEDEDEEEEGDEEEEEAEEEPAAEEQPRAKARKAG